MGNVNLTGGLLGGLAQGLQYAMTLEERRRAAREEERTRRELMEIQRDKLSADIKQDEAKQALQQKQLEMMQPLIKQFLGPLLEQGGQGQGAPGGEGTVQPPFAPMGGMATGFEIDPGLTRRADVGLDPRLAGGGPGLVGADPRIQARPSTGNLIRDQVRSGQPSSLAQPWAWRTDPVAKLWADSFDSAAAENGLPPDLLPSMARAESNFDPEAKSKAGALGLMQFLPSTAAQYKIDPLNPDEAIHGAGRYMKDLLVKYQGNLPKALAAYNAGPGTVDRYGGVPVFTLGYLDKVLGNAQGARLAREDPQTAQAMQTPPSSFGPGAPKPQVTVQMNPMTGNLSFSFGPGEYTTNITELRLPDGSTQQMQIFTDKQTGKSHRVPLGAPVAPEDILKSQRDAQGLGFPAGTEINKRMAARIRMLPQLNPEERSIEIEQLKQLGSEFSGRRQGGMSLAEQAQARKEQDIRGAEKARIETRTATEPLTGAPLKEWNMLSGLNAKMERIGERYRDDLVGTPFHHGFLGLNREFQQYWQDSANGKYTGGLWTGAVNGLLQKFKGTLSASDEQFYKEIADLQDSILRERSGAATSNQEMPHIQALSLSEWNSPRGFKAGLERLRDDVHGRMRELQKSTTTPASRLQAPLSELEIVNAARTGKISKEDAVRQLKRRAYSLGDIEEFLR